MAQPQNSAAGIRILSLVWYKVLPSVFGGQKGVALFNEYLGRLAPLTCLCSKNNEPVKASYTIDNSLTTGKGQFLNPLSWRKTYTTAKRVKATHLLLEFPYHGIVALLCKKLLRLKLILHSHNIEADRFREQGKKWWKALFCLERLVMKNADFVFFKTEKDRQRAILAYKIDKTKSAIVPYGIEAKKILDKQKAKELIYKRHNLAPQTKLFLFAGTLDYGPNAVAMKNLETKVIPLLSAHGLNYKIIVCGRIVYKSFAQLKNVESRNLLYVGNVTDIEMYFTAADVFLDPVLGGGGVQTKLVDALSFDLNVVCFEGMEEGIGGADEKIFTAPKCNWNDFASATIKALNYHSPTTKAFFQHHSWEAIAANSFSFLQNT